MIVVVQQLLLKTSAPLLAKRMALYTCDYCAIVRLWKLASTAVQQCCPLLSQYSWSWGLASHASWNSILGWLPVKVHMPSRQTGPVTLIDGQPTSILQRRQIGAYLRRLCWEQRVLVCFWAALTRRNRNTAAQCPKRCKMGNCSTKYSTPQGRQLSWHRVCMMCSESIRPRDSSPL